MKTKTIQPHLYDPTPTELIANKPVEEIFENSSRLISLISDTTRLKIMWLLCHTEVCVAEIANTIEMTSPAVSHHLRILKDAGVIQSRKVGKEVRYKIADGNEANLIHAIIDNAFDIIHQNI